MQGSYLVLGLQKEFAPIANPARENQPSASFSMLGGGGASHGEPEVGCWKA